MSSSDEPTPEAHSYGTTIRARVIEFFCLSWPVATKRLGRSPLCQMQTGPTDKVLLEKERMSDVLEVVLFVFGKMIHKLGRSAKCEELPPRVGKKTSTIFQFTKKIQLFPF